jgi:hypothetical protein
MFLPGNLANVPLYQAGAGIRTPFGTLLPPSGQVVAYVRGTAGTRLEVDGDDAAVKNLLVGTLNAGLARCKSGRGDIVIALPGHTENISAADQMSSLVAGTKILCLGEGTSRPTFTWSAATSTFLFDVANVVFDGPILEMAGDPALTAALSVAAPITISAPGCRISSCLIRSSVDADQLATIPITTTAAADDLILAGITMYGGAGVSTTGVRVVGADRLRMFGCYFDLPTSSPTVGVVQFLTTASLNVRVKDCVFINRATSSVHALTGMTGLTGAVEDCAFGILDDATLAGFVTTGGAMGFRNHTVNLAGEEGVPSTVLSTV